MSVSKVRTKQNARIFSAVWPQKEKHLYQKAVLVIWTPLKTPSILGKST